MTGSDINKRVTGVTLHRLPRLHTSLVEKWGPFSVSRRQGRSVLYRSNESSMLRRQRLQDKYSIRWYFTLPHRAKGNSKIVTCFSTLTVSLRPVRRDAFDSDSVLMAFEWSTVNFDRPFWILCKFFSHKQKTTDLKPKENRADQTPSAVCTRPAKCASERYLMGY